MTRYRITRQDHTDHHTGHEAMTHAATLSRRNTSGYRGVWFDEEKQKWRAWICSRGRGYHLGTFYAAEDAARGSEMTEDLAEVDDTPIPINVNSPSRGHISATVECAACPRRETFICSMGESIDDELFDQGWDLEDYEVWYCPEHIHLVRQ